MSENLPEYVTICCGPEFAQTWLNSRAAEGYQLVGTVTDSYGGQGLTYVMRLTRQARIEQRAADGINELLNKAMDNDKLLLALQGQINDLDFEAREFRRRITALEAAHPAHTAGRVDSHAEAVRGLADRVEKLERQASGHDFLISSQTFAVNAEMMERIKALENQLPDLAERQDSQGQYIAALQADNASLRADLDAANRRWDAWAQIVQPELLKTSQLDTERRLAEVERRVEGQK